MPRDVGRRLTLLLMFATCAHAMWLFGNLYEEIVFVPNGLAASPAVFAGFNAYFARTEPYVYYVPLTQLGSLALLVVAARGRGLPSWRWLVVASFLSVAAIGLTVHIVVHYNLRLWLGDVGAMPAHELHQLTLEWGLWNALRIALLIGVVGCSWRGLADSTRTVQTGRPFSESALTPIG